MDDSKQHQRIRPGWFFHWHSHIYQIEQIDAEGNLQTTDMETHTSYQFSLSQLLVPTSVESLDEGEVIFAPTYTELCRLVDTRFPMPLPVNENTLPDALIYKAERIFKTVATVRAIISEERKVFALQGQLPRFRKTSALKRALASLPPELQIKKTQYYEYEHLFDTHMGNCSAIAASLRRKTFNQSRFPLALLHFVDEGIQRYYARSTQKRKSSVFADMANILRRTRSYWIDPEQCRGDIPQELIDELIDPRIPIEVILSNPEKAAMLTQIEMPSQSWFYQYVKWYENIPSRAEQIYIERYGIEAWESTFMVFDHFASAATFPLEYVVADHWLFDVPIVDDEKRSETSRLWLTALIDVKTRAILGFALLDEYPCIESILTALLHSIWPKVSLNQFDIHLPWICFGIPQHLSMDNAWAHHSYTMDVIGNKLSRKGQFTAMHILYRPPHKARYGAIIERFLGNLSAQTKESLPGAIQSSNWRDVSRARQQACLIYDDLERFANQRIVKYMHTPHSELGGITPHEAWLAGVEAFGEPKVPTLTNSLRYYFWRLDPKTRRVTEKGVHAFGMHYYAPELALIPRLDKRYQIRSHSIRYDPDELNRIALFVEDDSGEDQVVLLEATELRRPDGSLRSLSKAKRGLAQEAARLKGKSVRSWLEELDKTDSTEHLEELKALRKKEQRAAKKRQNGISKALPKLDIVATANALEHDDLGSEYDDYDEFFSNFATD